MKNIAKSFGLMGLFILVQILVSYGFLIFRIITDVEWFEMTYQYFVDGGLLNMKYLSALMEVIMPTMVISDFLLIIPMLINMVRTKEYVFHKLSAKAIFTLFSLGVVVNAFVSWQTERLPSGSATSQYDGLMDLVFNGSPLFTLLTVGIAAPIVEELIFRYGIIKIYKTKNEWLAIIVSSFMFGLAHFNLVQSTYAFFTGLLLGYLYVKSGNLWYSLIVHLTVNTTSVLYMYAPIWLQGIMMLCVSACALYLIYQILHEMCEKPTPLGVG